MKSRNYFIAIITGVALSTTAYSNTNNDSLGLPGDNFDLYGALHLFKQSESPEAFEKAINAKDNEINNLDLNNDGLVDYIQVIDQSEGDAHAFVLRDAESESKTQDVAVIEIEKSGTDNAHLQIVGSEDLYGKDYIVEPADENQKTEAASAIKTNTTVVVNVWAWPSVHYIYGPHYRRWASPWHYRHYPVWFSPWHPVFWHVHFNRVHRYHHPYYHRVNVYRAPHAHKVYYGHRSSNPNSNKKANVAAPHRSTNKQVNKTVVRTNRKPANHKSGNRKNGKR